MENKEANKEKKLKSSPTKTLIMEENDVEYKLYSKPANHN